jgi:integrase
MPRPSKTENVRTRKRIGKGIYRDQWGLAATVKVRGQQREKRFAADASLKTIKAWQGETRVSLRKLAPLPVTQGTLSADVADYLERVKAMPTYEERARHLGIWLDALGRQTFRAAVTAGDIRIILHGWRDAGLGPATCNKRRTALMHVWTVLDGKGARNPVRDVPKFRPPDPLPRGRDYGALRRALDLMADCKTKARLLVMFWTGMRPAEVMRAQPEDIAWKHRYIIVRTAKGGRTRTVPLTAGAVRAWRDFDKQDAWGRFTLAPMNRMLKRGTAMADCKVYDLRHSYGTALARKRVRLDVIGALMGHSSLELTKRYTLAAVAPEAAEAAKRLAVAAGSGRKSRKSA